MTLAPSNGASPNAHLLIGEMPAPRLFERRGWEGTGLSLAAHAIVFGILAYAATHVQQVVQTADTASKHLKFVFLDRPGPGGGGGGGGTVSPDPATRAEIPLTKPIDITPVSKPADTPPPPDLNIPAVTVQAAQLLPGATVAVMDASSPGRGTGPGGGDGHGPGIGPGDGAGLGPGRVSGVGGDVPFAGNGITSPELIREVKPNYTADAMRAKVQGLVQMDAVVRADGSVDPASLHITRSLDAVLGLDQQAIIAVKQWKFKPATLKGQPVDVRVLVELTFTLR
jgi:TonB family protein